MNHAGRKAEQLLRRFHDVQAAARAAAVPVHLVLAGNAPDSQQLLATPEQSAVHITGDGGLSWSKTDLAEALAMQGRTSLVLCGFWLETTVTFLALPALANGFDVMVLMETTPARSDEARRPAGDRLLQAGAVPATARQLIAEWAEQTPDPHVCSSLSNLIAID